MRSQYVKVSITALVIGLAPAAASAAQYTFERVSEVVPRAVGVWRPIPSINNYGEIAFYSDLASTPGVIGLYTGTPSGVTPIVELPAGQQFGDLPVINNASQVSFEVVGFSFFMGYAPGLYVGTTTGLDPVLTAPFPEHAAFAKRHSIADDGTVSFASQRGGDPGLGGTLADPEKLIYLAREGNLLQVDSLVKDGPVIFNGIERTALSDGGILAYSWQSGDFLSEQIVRVHDDDRTVIASVSTLEGDLGSFAVNDNGRVAYVMTLDALSLQSSLQLGNSDSTTLIATAGSHESFTSFLDVSLNNLGDVAFWAGTDDLAHGIFTGADPLSDVVVRMGDMLDGSEITQILFGGNGLNDAGQIAFYAEFTDGSAAQYIATPVAVPEASTFIMAATGLVAFLLIRMARNPVDRGKSNTVSPH